MQSNFCAASGVTFPEEVPFMQHQRIAVIAISCVLIASGFTQTSNPAGAKQANVAGVGGPNVPAAGNPDAVGMNDPVITLKGACEPAGNVAPASDCISSVTRAQFEKLANALQPGMPPDAKRAFATNYGKLLIYADAARTLHMENDPEVQLIMQFVTNQVLADGLRRHYAQEYSHPTDQQVQDYYAQNSAKYLEATLQRIIVPHRATPGDKPDTNQSDEQAAAEKIRQQWIAGGDPIKLQQAAYEAAGVTGAGTPNVDLGARNPGSLPPNQESVFQLKAGEVSQVYSDAAASYIYKAVAVREIPLSEVKDSIAKTLQQQLLQDKLQEIGKSATPVIDEAYFGPAPAPGAPGAAGRPMPTSAPPPVAPPK
jgi:hypothetical protein